MVCAFPAHECCSAIPFIWLADYDQVCSHNLWDDTIKLANAVFFLNHTALNRFDNHEEELSSWDIFKAKFGKVSGKPDCRKQQAREKLSWDFQASDVTSTSYIEDVHLCCCVDDAMSEEDKHLFKGL